MTESIHSQLNQLEETCKQIKPLVAVRCPVYNHDKFLRQTLDGFVMQRTNFRFVAIVHDDVSTDTSVAIIKEYAQKYPEIIIPLFESENQYSKRNGSLKRIMNKACELSGAKYVALCEGDDYWDNPMKLQIQVDYMEANPEYSMCFHSVRVIQENSQVINIESENIEDREYLPQEVLLRWIIPTCSVLLKRECIIQTPYHKDFFVGDNVLWATCLCMGKIRGLSAQMGVYRRTVAGWTERSISNRAKRYETYGRWIKHYQAMKSAFTKIESSIFDEKILENMTATSCMDLLTFKPVFFRNFKVFKKERGTEFVNRLCKEIYSTLLNKLKRKLS